MGLVSKGKTKKGKVLYGYEYSMDTPSLIKMTLENSVRIGGVKIFYKNKNKEEVSKDYPAEKVVQACEKHVFDKVMIALQPDLEDAEPLSIMMTIFPKESRFTMSGEPSREEDIKFVGEYICGDAEDEGNDDFLFGDEDSIDEPTYAAMPDPRATHAAPQPQVAFEAAPGNGFDEPAPQGHGAKKKKQKKVKPPLAKNEKLHNEDAGGEKKKPSPIVIAACSIFALVGIGGGVYFFVLPMFA